MSETPASGMNVEVNYSYVNVGVYDNDDIEVLPNDRRNGTCYASFTESVRIIEETMNPCNIVFGMNWLSATRQITTRSLHVECKLFR